MSPSTASLATLVVATLAIISAITPAASAHFTLTGSREQSMWQSNLKYYPIAGSPNARPITDCLQVPSKTPIPVTPGSTRTEAYDVGNHATHVGVCKGAIIDAKTGSTVATLPDVLNCVANSQAYSWTVPNINCPACVLKVSVTAVHLGPDHAENYDSCLDISIAGGSGSGSGGSNSGYPNGGKGSRRVTDQLPSVQVPANIPTAAPAIPAVPVPAAPAVPVVPVPVKAPEQRKVVFPRRPSAAAAAAVVTAEH
ncbi:hypothetical protein H9P43_004785 [Blastocladiella emersonii ATCC 22665]|nr:hypothetical protein H9P43_004785 [Blastocladiella emersonii ATCC 22665]